MKAYNKIYLLDAADCLGEAVDYVVNICQINYENFFEMFVTGSFGSRFEEGDPSVVSGMSGTELACRVMEETGLYFEFPPARRDYSANSNEYSLGFYLAYFQWYSGRSFRNIFSNLDMTQFVNLLPELRNHEDGWRLDKFSGIIEQFKEIANIQSVRKTVGFSQKEFANITGVSLKSLQQYEAKTKDIGKASVTTLLNISREIGCSINDLLEY